MKGSLRSSEVIESRLRLINHERLSSILYADGCTGGIGLVGWMVIIGFRYSKSTLGANKASFSQYLRSIPAKENLRGKSYVAKGKMDPGVDCFNQLFWVCLVW